MILKMCNINIYVRVKFGPDAEIWVEAEWTAANYFKQFRRLYVNGVKVIILLLREYYIHKDRGVETKTICLIYRR